MDLKSTEYLELITKNSCYILLEKAVPSGKLKREVISLATHDGRALTLSTPQGFSARPFEIPRAIFDEFLAASLIEQDGPEDSGGRILFRLTLDGYSRAALESRKNAMTVAPYSDFTP